MSSSCSVVIATRNRVIPLRECLESLAVQSVRADDVVIVDTSDAEDTESLCNELRSRLELPLQYFRGEIRSAAVQRNEGAQHSTGDIILFLDDDVVLESNYVEEILAVFDEDRERRVGGVSGTIVNQTYAAPSWLNRLLLRLCIGVVPGPGKLVGPAVNMLPADVPNTRQRVEWLNSTGTAYRREVFLCTRFPESYRGYSFMEDVHLSARVGLEYTLMNTTRARLFHNDLGKKTHADWRDHGRSMIVNRYSVMNILKKDKVYDHVRLLTYELVYGSMVAMRRSSGGVGLQRTLQLFTGRLAGYVQILHERSRHS